MPPPLYRCGGNRLRAIRETTNIGSFLLLANDTNFDRMRYMTMNKFSFSLKLGALLVSQALFMGHALAATTPAM
jgi:hypothetical protein